MSNSTGQELLNLLEDHINVGTTSASTDPTQSLLVKWLNIAQRKVAFQLKPSILKNTAGTSVSVTAGDRSVAVPSSMLQIDNVFYYNSSSSYKELVKKKIDNVINPGTYFGTGNNVTPQFYEIRGGSIVLDAPFQSTNAAGLKLFGISAPTDVSIADLSPEVTLPKEYDMLIVYKASGFFYLRDDDTSRFGTQKKLEQIEISELGTILNDNSPKSITLDQNFFLRGDR